MSNLATARDEDLDSTPAAGGRSIRDIAHHIGGAYVMYANHAWGPGDLSWDDPALAGPSGDRALLTAWLEGSLEPFIAGLEALAGDEELDVQRNLSWGGTASTRQIARAMIEHTLYHTGEINHLRALIQGTDRWPWS
jgi:uncharacterized damage-inducible protein DinB